MSYNWICVAEDQGEREMVRQSRLLGYIVSLAAQFLCEAIWQFS